MVLINVFLKSVCLRLLLRYFGGCFIVTILTSFSRVFALDYYWDILVDVSLWPFLPRSWGRYWRSGFEAI